MQTKSPEQTASELAEKCAKCFDKALKMEPGRSVAYYRNDFKQLILSELKLVSLIEDKERLDWLQSNLDRYTIKCGLAYNKPFWISNQRGRLVGDVGKDLRDAVDAAMKDS